MQNDAVLTMRGIDKQFPGTKALSKVDFTLRKGEIHALMGENGAGKSTLIKVLTGVHEKDGGSIWVEGVEGEAHIHSPQEAQNIGIATVYQEITLCPNLTVAENMFIGRTEGQLVHWKDYEKRATEILNNLGILDRELVRVNGKEYEVRRNEDDTYSAIRTFEVFFSRNGYAEVQAASAEEARRIADEEMKYDDVSWDDDWHPTDVQLEE